jgi:hypothetical protein
MTVSLPYFAPAGDMALRFDAGSSAGTRLPDGLLAGDGFAMACWMTFPDGHKTDCCAVVVGNDTGGVAIGLLRSKVAMIPFRGPADGSGQLPHHVTGPSYRPGQGWLYVAVSTTKPEWLRVLVVGDDPPMTDESGLHAISIAGFQHATLVRVGYQPGAWQEGGPKPFRGAIARLRLWRKAMTFDELMAARFDLPTVRAGHRPELAADWRMTEGQGEIAFDYAAPSTNLGRLASPPGNHLRFTGDPMWVVANLPIPPNLRVKS